MVLHEIEFVCVALVLICTIYSRFIQPSSHAHVVLKIRLYLVAELKAIVSPHCLSPHRQRLVFCLQVLYGDGLAQCCMDRGINVKIVRVAESKTI